MFKWVSGRQNGSYYKCKIFEFRLWNWAFDCYLLKYPVNSFIQRHIDPVDDMDHWRLNIVTKHAERGGVFTSDTTTFRIGKRVVLFRPDKSKHCVSPVLDGMRMVLSFGFAAKK